MARTSRTTKTATLPTQRKRSNGRATMQKLLKFSREELQQAGSALNIVRKKVAGGK